jgi:hypothetical protein
MIKAIQEKAETFFCVAAGVFQVGVVLVLFNIVSGLHQ